MRRGIAWVLDGLVRLALIAMLVLMVEMASVFGPSGYSQGTLLVVFFAMEWGYFVLFELVWGGRTPGKKAMGLRVLREDGTSVRLGDSVLRNLLRAADILPGNYAVGFLVSAGDDRFRRLGDLVAGTIVVVEKSSKLAGKVSKLVPPPTDEELATTPAIRLTADEMDALDLFVRRRDALNLARARELAALIAGPLATRCGLPEPRDPARFLSLLHLRSSSSKVSPK